MFGSQILDVAMGVAFVYLLLSLVCTAVREGVEAWFKTRAVYLEQGIRELLQDPDGTGLTQDLYAHPLIKSLFKGAYVTAAVNARHWFNRSNLPAYIPSRNFAAALLDLAARGPVPAGPSTTTPASPVLPLAAIRAKVEGLETIHSMPLQRALLTAIDSANGDLAAVQANLEAWFDSAMDRVSGWYKRRTHAIVLFLALAGTIALNVNTIRLATYLYQNRAARDAVAAEASLAQAQASDLGSAKPSPLVDRIEALSLPVGWTGGLLGEPAPGEQAPNEWDQALTVILGWLMTAFAVSLGAPFWFDMLNKIMVIRSTVKPAEKSQEEGSEDRRPASPRPPASGGALGAVDRSTIMLPAPDFQGRFWATGDPQEGVL